MDYPWADRFTFVSTIDSTNSRLKQLALQGAPHGTVLAADHQSGGRGRQGRSFLSPAGQGIYLSMLLRPECKPVDLMHLTCATAVAMCDAVEQSTGVRPQIKWTNDLVIGREKIAGILTELGLKADGTVDFAIIGIGINCCQQQEQFPEELRGKAASLEMVLGHSVSRARIAAAMMTALQKMDAKLLTQRDAILIQYRGDCMTLGQEISVVRGDSVRHGKALDIDAEGGLIVEYSDGSTQTVSSGEVSVRGMYGYV